MLVIERSPLTKLLRALMPPELRSTCYKHTSPSCVFSLVILSAALSGLPLGTTGCSPGKQPFSVGFKMASVDLLQKGTDGQSLTISLSLSLSLSLPVHTHALDGKHVTFESTMYPSQHIGILPDGCVKPPNQTGTGNHARYTPTIISYVSLILKGKGCRSLSFMAW